MIYVKRGLEKNYIAKPPPIVTRNVARPAADPAAVHF
jgi:hypothetical protein